MVMISVEEGKAKVSKLGVSDSVKAELTSVLKHEKELTPENTRQDTIFWLESRLAQEHLAYLAKDQVNKVWGKSTSLAIKELADNWYLKFDANAPVVGQSNLLAILDGSKPSKNAVKTYVKGQPISVRYYRQIDSDTDEGYRMCFTSTDAMLLEFCAPGTLHGYNGDDQYLQRVKYFGDTTDANAQQAALNSYKTKYKFEFSNNLAIDDLEKQIRAGIPFSAGTLHTGHVSNPTGFGHWLLVIGITADGKGYFVHDPYGFPDTENGTYDLSRSGKNIIYPKANFIKRWMVNGQPGWGMLARRA